MLAQLKMMVMLTGTKYRLKQVSRSLLPFVNLIACSDFEGNLGVYLYAQLIMDALINQFCKVSNIHYQRIGKI